MRALALCLLVLLTSVCAHAAGVRTCSELLRPASAPSTLTSRVRAYANEVVATKGIRLILKPSQAEERPKKWSVLRRFHDLVFVRPIERASLALGAREKLRLSLLVEIPLTLYASVALTQPMIDYSFNKAADIRVEWQIRNQRHDFNNLIHADYRYREISSDHDRDGILSIQQARTSYLESLSTPRFDDLDWNLKLLSHPYFSHIAKVMNGVPDSPGYKIPASSRKSLTTKQLLALFKINHRLQLRLEVLGNFYDPTTDRLRVAPKTNLERAVWQSVLDSPFEKELLELHRLSKISDGELLYRLQEDQVWSAKFDEWKILGIERLKVNGNDTFSDVPLELRDVQLETLNELAKPHAQKSFSQPTKG